MILDYFVKFIVFLEKISSPKKTKTESTSTEKKKRSPLVLKDSIIPDEDDLLKDMDLSDLDSLNLDDFK